MSNRESNPRGYRTSARRAHNSSRETSYVWTPWNWGEWGLQEDKWKRSFLVGSLGLSCQYKKDFCSALVALFGPVKKYFLVVLVQEIFVLPWLLYGPVKTFFPHRTLFQPLSPSTSKLGKQTCWVACLLCLWPHLSQMRIPFDTPLTILHWQSLLFYFFYLLLFSLPSLCSMILLLLFGHCKIFRSFFQSAITVTVLKNQRKTNLDNDSLHCRTIHS